MTEEAEASRLAPATPIDEVTPAPILGGGSEATAQVNLPKFTKILLSKFFFVFSYFSKKRKHHHQIKMVGAYNLPHLAKIV